MKTVFLILTLVAVSTGIFAREPSVDALKEGQVTIEGMVSDKLSGESLTGVKVWLEGSDAVGYTDFDGKFKIDNIKAGTYTVLVEYISYDSERLEEISLNGKTGQNLSIKLRPSTIKVGTGNN
jgi:hypothetical protein